MKKLLIVFLAMITMFSFVACDPQDGVVEEPIDVEGVVETWNEAWMSVTNNTVPGEELWETVSTEVKPNEDGSVSVSASMVLENYTDKETQVLFKKIELKSSVIMGSDGNLLSYGSVNYSADFKYDNADYTLTFDMEEDDVDGIAIKNAKLNGKSIDSSLIKFIEITE